MAAHDSSSALLLLQDISDGSEFVHQAMNALGFACDFSELTVGDMQLALALAQHFKRAQGQPEVWES